jgi:uncharacterized protein (TIGR00369 family)
MAFNPQLVQEIFDRAGFIRRLGIQLVASAEGSCETRLELRDDLRQQHGFAHAAVLSAMADHTAGGAAASVVSPGKDVITVEFRITFVRPGTGPFFYCKGVVLRAGKDLIFAEAEVTGSASEKDGAKLVAKLSSTLKIIPHS